MARLARWAAVEPDRIACVVAGTDEAITYGALDARANRVAQWLIGMGLEPGAGIALLLENRIEFLEITFGARRAGLYWTPLSIHARPREIGHVLRDSGARVLIVSPTLAGLAMDVVGQGEAGGVTARFALGAGLRGYRSYEAALAHHPRPAPLPERPVGRDLLYSSGTTGLPKGILRPLAPPEDHGKPEPAAPWTTHYGLGRNTVYLSPGPLYHAAPGRFVMRTITEGGTVVLMRKFDPAAALEAIARHRVTVSQWVPTMFHRLLALPEAERRRHDLSSHRRAIHAAAPCPPAVKRAMIDWWGPILVEYYSGSETIGSTVIDTAEWLAHPGSVGRAMPGFAVHVTGPDGRELPPGEVGQVWFSGGTPFAYRNAPEKTAAAIDAQRGWATLGDLGWVDAAGFLYLSDRRADLILSGGVNVYPAEIEAVLAEHPAVAEVAVVGVPDTEFGERPLALVVPRDPDATGDDLAASLTAFCRDRLSGPKTPRRVEFVAELPRSEAGKLLRRVLKERVLADPSASTG
jgi:long-chain acyl-CoA synthetase